MKDQPAQPLTHPPLDDLIAQTLSSGQFSTAAAVAQHLATCQSCAHSFQQQVLFETASQVRALQAHPVGISPALSDHELAGMLALWQAALDASMRLEDDWSAATALSVIGMLRREQRDDEEARLVHQLALKSAVRSGNLLSQAISHTDLGALAMKQQNTYSALEHLTSAGRSAAQLHDREAEARARLLMLRAMAQSFVQVFDGLPDLLTQAMSLLRELLLAPAQAQLRSFYHSWLQPVYSMAPAVGDSLLVLNTGRRIPVILLEGPSVDEHGMLKLRLKTTQDLEQWNIPAAAELDLVFIPAQTVIGAQPLTQATRLYLMSNKGLVIMGQLPGMDDALMEQLRKARAALRGDLVISIEHFALQIHW